MYFIYLYWTRSFTCFGLERLDCKTQKTMKFFYFKFGFAVQLHTKQTCRKLRNSPLKTIGSSFENYIILRTFEFQIFSNLRNIMFFFSFYKGNIGEKGQQDLKCMANVINNLSYIPLHHYVKNPRWNFIILPIIPHIWEKEKVVIPSIFVNQTLY